MHGAHSLQAFSYQAYNSYNEAVFHDTDLPLKRPPIRQNDPSLAAIPHKGRRVGVAQLLTQSNDICQIVTTGVQLNDRQVLKQARAAMTKATQSLALVSIDVPDPDDPTKTKAVPKPEISFKDMQKAHKKMTTAMDIAQAAFRSTKRAHEQQRQDAASQSAEALESACTELEAMDLS